MLQTAKLRKRLREIRDVRQIKRPALRHQTFDENPLADAGRDQRQVHVDRRQREHGALRNQAHIAQLGAFQAGRYRAERALDVALRRERPTGGPGLKRRVERHAHRNQQQNCEEAGANQKHAGNFHRRERHDRTSQVAYYDRRSGSGAPCVRSRCAGVAGARDATLLRNERVGQPHRIAQAGRRHVVIIVSLDLVAARGGQFNLRLE